MTRLLLTLLSLLAAPLLLVWSAPPAQACSCAGGSVAENAEGSDAVFVATMAADLEESGVGLVEARADVDLVYAGDVPDQVTISTGAQESACGLTRLRAGRTWLFFTTAGTDDTFRVSLCGGNSPTGRTGDPAVERVLGPGRAVLATPSPDPAPAPTSDAAPPAEPDDDRTGLLLGGAAAVVVLAVAAVVVRRRVTG